MDVEIVGGSRDGETVEVPGTSRFLRFSRFRPIREEVETLCGEYYSIEIDTIDLPIQRRPDGRYVVFWREA